MPIKFKILGKVRDSVLINETFHRKTELGRRFTTHLEDFADLNHGQNDIYLKSLDVVVYFKTSIGILKYNHGKYTLVDVDLLGGFLSAFVGIFGSEVKENFNQFTVEDRYDASKRFFFISSENLIISMIWREHSGISFAQAKQLLQDLIDYTEKEGRIANGK